MSHNAARLSAPTKKPARSIISAILHTMRPRRPAASCPRVRSLVRRAAGLWPQSPLVTLARGLAGDLNSGSTQDQDVSMHPASRVRGTNLCYHTASRYVLRWSVAPNLRMSETCSLILLLNGQRRQA